MRLLLLGGDLGTTGFGTVTRDLMAALVEIDCDVRLLTFADAIPRDLADWLRARLVVVPRLPEWVGLDETLENDAHNEVVEQRRSIIVPKFSAEGYEDGWAPDAALVVGDPASLDRFGLVGMLPDGFPAFHYVPVEGIGLPPAWRRLWERITPIAMAKSGALEISRLMGSEPPVVYHGIDTEVFHPVDHDHPIIWPEGEAVIESRADAKKAFGIDPKTTVILRTDANAPRKAYGSLFRAVAPVLAAHEDVILFVHSPLRGEGGDLRVFRSHFIPQVAARIVLPGFHERYGGIPRYGLATLYNAADIYVSNSCEGFGLTIAEAIACGVPAVGIDFSAVPEVIGPAGSVVPVGQLIENIYAHWWAVADERKFGMAVERFVTDRGARWRAGGKGPEHVRNSFSWATAARQFVDVIEGSLVERIAA